MTPPVPEAPEKRFEEAFKKWAARPPRLSPRAAAARMTTMIQRRQQRRRPSWAFAAAAAALFVVIAIGFHWARLSPPPPVSQPVIAAQEVPPLGEGEVLMWLDRDTPLYMTFQPPAENRAKGGKP